MYIANIFDVLALITPFTKMFRKMHINKDGLNFECLCSAADRILTCQNRVCCSSSTVQQEHICTEICFPLAGSVTSVRDNSKKVEDLAPFAMFVHAVIADV